jgi:mannosyl-oligosaccharide glucosidase
MPPNQEILFTRMREEIDVALQKYGIENPPPPPQVFTLPNTRQSGNMHFIQKVFQGAFEVRCVRSVGGPSSRHLVRHSFFFWICI